MFACVLLFGHFASVSIFVSKYVFLFCVQDLRYHNPEEKSLNIKETRYVNIFCLREAKESYYLPRGRLLFIVWSVFFKYLLKSRYVDVSKIIIKTRLKASVIVYLCPHLRPNENPEIPASNTRKQGLTEVCQPSTRQAANRSSL